MRSRSSDAHRSFGRDGEEENPRVSKLSDYLQKHKVDARRIVATSKGIEGLQPEDRAIRLAREQAKDGDEAAKELAAKKRRSGRSVTRPTIERAIAGKPLTRKARARVLRAVNAVLAQKSKGKTEAKPTDLF
jgi:hypothetical protein